MLSWYSEQIKSHGWGAATRLLWRVVLVKTRDGLLDRVSPAAVQCPCCAWTGHNFRDYLEVRFTAQNIECPRCFSHPRHRGLFLWATREFNLKQKCGRGLLFAPEHSLGALWQSTNGLRVTRVDLISIRGVDVMADLQSLPFKENSIDLIWCHHVLTEVADDHQALDELRRVLRPKTGELILSVNLQSQAITIEFDGPNQSLLNQRRIYGQDFAARLKSHGLEARPTHYGLTPEEYSYYGVIPDEVFFVCTKNDS